MQIAGRRICLMQIERMRICSIEWENVWGLNPKCFSEKTENGGKFSKFDTILFAEKYKIVRISETKCTY